MGFPSTRLLSFMFLAPFMLGLSPTGICRLPSGHGVHGYVYEHVHEDLGLGGWRGAGRFGECPLPVPFGIAPVSQSEPRSVVPLPRPSHRTWGFPPSGVASRFSVKGYGAVTSWLRCTMRLGIWSKAPIFRISLRRSTSSNSDHLFASVVADSQIVGFSCRFASVRS